MEEVYTGLVFLEGPLYGLLCPSLLPHKPSAWPCHLALAGSPTERVKILTKGQIFLIAAPTSDFQESGGSARVTEPVPSPAETGG